VLQGNGKMLVLAVGPHALLGNAEFNANLETLVDRTEKVQFQHMAQFCRVFGVALTFLAFIVVFCLRLGYYLEYGASHYQIEHYLSYDLT
jgi:hypothetical protein